MKKKAEVLQQHQHQRRFGEPSDLITIKYTAERTERMEGITINSQFYNAAN